jgi:uncharacterized protein YecE (DUF72 family)
MSLPLFPDPPDDRPPLAARLGPRLRALAERGVYLGTSSWKYEGWLGRIYTPERYVTRGKFSKTRFEETCLAEYAETFPVVGGDFSFYQFPTRDYWDRLFGETPPTLLFSLKVPEEITVARWPRHARYGPRAGQDNPHFLDAAVFRKLFFAPLSPHAQRVAALVFEFGAFSRWTFPAPDDFLTRLDGFLGALPPGPRYSVEVRNPEYLTPGYFALLASHNVAHVFNAWTRMPAIGDQLDLPGAYTADFSVFRVLLQPGRLYEDAVKQFTPYREVQEPDEGTRSAMRRAVACALDDRRPMFASFNNRLEGFAPGTIEAVIDDLDIP